MTNSSRPYFLKKSSLLMPPWAWAALGATLWRPSVRMSPSLNSRLMAVSTNSRVPQFRKTLTEMLLAEHLNANPGGRPNELADLAEELGAETPLVLPDAKRKPYDDRNRLMGYDPDACILCARCVRYTQEVMMCSALSI